MPAQVVSAPLSEQDRVLPTIVAAFIADPLIRWMLPDAGAYFAHFGNLMIPFAGGAFEHGSAYRSEDFVGAALWLPPGVHPDEEAMGAIIQSALPSDRVEEVFGLLEQIGPQHPAEEHWYLPVIGVDPRAQGQGYGSLLLRHSLEVIDRNHAIAYLESSNPRNNPLYERFGFEVQAELRSGSSPPIWPMVRAAR